MKRSEIPGYLAILDSEHTEIPGKWNYAIAKNRRKLKEAKHQLQVSYNKMYLKELTAINVDNKKVSKKIIDPTTYQKESLELIKKHSHYEHEQSEIKDGSQVKTKVPMQFKDQFGNASVWHENVEAYNLEAKAHDEKFAQEKLFLENYNKTFDAFLEKDIKFDFHMISPEDIPETVLPSFLEELDFIIKD